MSITARSKKWVGTVMEIFSHHAIKKPVAQRRFGESLRVGIRTVVGTVLLMFWCREGQGRQNTAAILSLFFSFFFLRHWTIHWGFLIRVVCTCSDISGLMPLPLFPRWPIIFLGASKARTWVPWSVLIFLWWALKEGDCSSPLITAPRSSALASEFHCQNVKQAKD